MPSDLCAVCHQVQSYHNHPGFDRFFSSLGFDSIFLHGQAEAPMAPEAKAEEVAEVKERGPRHYHIEHPYVCIGESRVEYVPTPTPSSLHRRHRDHVEEGAKRVRQYVTTINGTSTLDRRSPVETLGSSSSSFDAAALSRPRPPPTK
uniref:Uncharacterized protein n=1 Tax=Ananas comosus var. bracteatus TaxID=296719 RepID=A0A6V7P0P8_ANACO|nr:unnamed protein product [Ananas comosus var. bracteatus]